MLERKLLPMMGNVYQPRLARLVRKHQLSGDTTLFAFRFEDPDQARRFTYRPGQFVEVSVLGVGEAPISISSTPTRPGLIELVVRRVGRVTDALHRLEPNAAVGLRGPYGNGWPIEKLRHQDLAIIAGGLGMAPLRSLLNYVLDNRAEFGRLVVMYGARTPDDLLFKDELADLGARSDLDLLLAVDQDPTGTWNGRVGVVTTLFEGRQFDPQRTYALVCVPPVAFKYVAAELTQRGFPGERILMSLERKMQCGVGKCGYCNVGHKYTCLDGPVFSYWDAINLPGMI
ncbi:MAG: FAD/NAD(P)-binding protein [Bacillota bacterium]|nr:FAD/NAD(P)-binding protein [Bacillota bacterium]